MDSWKIFSLFVHDHSWTGVGDKIGQGLPWPNPKRRLANQDQPAVRGLASWGRSLLWAHPGLLSLLLICRGNDCWETAGQILGSRFRIQLSSDQHLGLKCKISRWEDGTFPEPVLKLLGTMTLIHNPEVELWRRANKSLGLIGHLVQMTLWRSQRKTKRKKGVWLLKTNT